MLRALISAAKAYLAVKAVEMVAQAFSARSSRGGATASRPTRMGKTARRPATRAKTA